MNSYDTLNKLIMVKVKLSNSTGTEANKFHMDLMFGSKQAEQYTEKIYMKRIAKSKRILTRD